MTKSRQRKDPGPETFAAKVRVILFDIDGTLVLTGGAGVRAMTRAFHDVFSVPDAFGSVTMAGRTDAVIVSDAATVHGIPNDDPGLTSFRDVYLEHLRNEINAPGPRKGIMPGVRPLLDTLACRSDVYVALLTGNCEQGARLKLEHFDLWRFFPCGAFGDEVTDRNDLFSVAMLRARESGVPEIAPRNVLVVGDTELDVACAAAAGARSVAVATGPSDSAALRQSGADFVFDDLSDTAAFLLLL